MQEPLVLIPGMMCDGRLFMPQLAAFTSQRPVLVIPPIGESTMTALAQSVLDVAPARFALAGLSMGGIVAMEVIRLAPQRVTRLALLDTNPLADPPEKAPVRAEQVKKVRAGELQSVMREEMKPLYLAPGPEQSAILDLCMKMAEALGAGAFEQQTQAIATRPDQCDTLRAVKVPALIACGAEDQLCPVERHQLMHQLVEGSRLEVIAGAGHLPTLEQPEQSNKVLSEWLSL
jgi:pimeloyl-ACP methyl ester carboxylesterase